MNLVSAGRLRDVLRSTFWLVPAACVVAAIALAIGLVSVDNALIGSDPARFLFPGPPAGARSILSAIIQAMIAFTGLVFSITVVVLALASSQFSPRVLRTFLRDRTIQWALGLFVATFVYAIVVDRNVLGTTEENGFVPRIAVTVALVLVLGSVAQFIHYIDHVADMIRVVSIISTVGNESVGLLERRCPTGLPPSPARPDLSSPSVRWDAPRAGVLVSVNEAAIVEHAARYGCVIEILPRVGDFVPYGAPLARLHPDSQHPGHLDRSPGWLGKHLALAGERTTEQDLAFGFRQLIDIAERALSPAINDPTTACQAIDTMHDLLRRLATRNLPAGLHTDTTGQVRLIVAQYTFADYLRIVVAEIWHYGHDAAQVPARLADMLHDLASVARPDLLPDIEHWLRVVEPARPGTPPSPQPPRTANPD